MLSDYDGNKRYLDKVTSEHRIRPKYMAMNAVYLNKLQDIYELYTQLMVAFDLERAVGKQLDTIGEIVGANRVLDFNPTYAKSKLDDDQYRKLIKAQISTNQWDGTLRGLVTLWEEIFEGYRITVLDRQDMSILVQFHGVRDLFEAELIANGYFAPRPEGVMVNYELRLDSKLEKTVYIGGKVSAVYTEFILPTRRSQEFWEIGGGMYEASILSVHTSYTLPSDKAERSR